MRQKNVKIIVELYHHSTDFIEPFLEIPLTMTYQNQFDMIGQATLIQHAFTGLKLNGAKVEKVKVMRDRRNRPS